MRIFYLDDEEYGRDMIRQFRKIGHTVDWAKSVAGASWYLEDEPGVKAYDYLIFDLLLPEGEVIHPDGSSEWYGREGVAVGIEYIRKNRALLRQKIEQGRVAILTGFALALRPEIGKVLNDLKKEFGGVEIKQFDRASDDVTRATTQWLGL
jgi:ActR/RegA family two-component response regulator